MRIETLQSMMIQTAKLLKKISSKSSNERSLRGCYCNRHQFSWQASTERQTMYELRIVWRKWSCWWPHDQSGRCTTDTSLSTRNFSEYWNSSVIVIHGLARAAHPCRGKQRAYLVEKFPNVFSGRVATQLRWGGTICLFRSWKIRILCA